MPKAKFSSHYDYVKRGSGMTSYPKGYEGDIPQSHYDAAAAAGKLEGVAQAKQDAGEKAPGDKK